MRFFSLATLKAEKQNRRAFGQLTPSTRRSTGFRATVPRVTFWAGPDTTPADRERFLGFGSAARVHVTENVWLGRLRSVKLYVYSFAPEPFVVHPEPGGFYVSEREVVPERCDAVGNLLQRHADAGLELRFTPSLWPLQRAVAASSL